MIDEEKRLQILEALEYINLYPQILFEARVDTLEELLENVRVELLDRDQGFSLYLDEVNAEYGEALQRLADDE